MAAAAEEAEQQQRESPTHLFTTHTHVHARFIQCHRRPTIRLTDQELLRLLAMLGMAPPAAINGARVRNTLLERVNLRVGQAGLFVVQDGCDNDDQ